MRGLCQFGQAGKRLRFNSALSCILSECALQVFSRRNPSKLNTLQRFLSPLEWRTLANVRANPGITPATPGTNGNIRGRMKQER